MNLKKIPLVLQKFIKSNFLKKTSWTLFGNLARYGLKAIYIVLIARVLGPEEYGKFISILSLTLILFPFSSWGSGQILLKYVTRDHKNFHNYWGAAFSTTIISGSILSLLIIIFYKLFISEDISLISVINITIADLVFGRILDISVWAFLAFEKMKHMTRLQVMSSVILLFCSIFQVAVSKTPTAETWSYYYMSTSFLMAIFALWMVYANLGWGKLNPMPILREYKEGFLFSIGNSSNSIYNDIDKTMLSKFQGPEPAGIYSAAYKFINILFIPISALMTAAYPRFFKSGEKGIRAGTQWAIKLLPISVGYGIITIPILFFLSKFVNNILGEGYSETSTVLYWLSPLILLKALHCFPADVLTGSGYQGSRTIIQLFVAGLNIILNLLLIPSFGWKGAAITSLASDGMLVVLLWGIIILKLPKTTNEKN